MTLSLRGDCQHLNISHSFYADAGSSLTSNWGHVLFHIFYEERMKWPQRNSEKQVGVRAWQGDEEGQESLLCETFPPTTPALQRLWSWNRGMPQPEGPLETKVHSTPFYR